MLTISPLIGRSWRRASRLTALVLAAAVLGETGCGSDSATGPSDTPVEGWYALMEVDHVVVPAPLHHGPWLDPEDVTFYNLFDAKVSDGVVVLDADGTFWIDITVDFIGDGQPGNLSFDFEGTYTVRGNEVFFTTEDGKQGSGTLRDGGLYLSLDVLGTNRFKDYRFVL